MKLPVRCHHLYIDSSWIIKKQKHSFRAAHFIHYSWSARQLFLKHPCFCIFKSRLFYRGCIMLSDFELLFFFSHHLEQLKTFQWEMNPNTKLYYVSSANDSYLHCLVLNLAAWRWGSFSFAGAGNKSAVRQENHPFFPSMSNVYESGADSEYLLWLSLAISRAWILLLFTLKGKQRHNERQKEEESHKWANFFSHTEWVKKLN